MNDQETIYFTLLWQDQHLIVWEISVQKSIIYYLGFSKRPSFGYRDFTILTVCVHPCSPKLGKQWTFWFVSMFTQDCWLFTANFSLLDQYLETRIVKMLPIPPKRAVPMKLPKATIVAQMCPGVPKVHCRPTGWDARWWISELQLDKCQKYIKETNIPFLFR